LEIVDERIFEKKIWMQTVKVKSRIQIEIIKSVDRM